MNDRHLWRFAPTCAIQTVGCPIRLHRVPCHSDATWARMKEETRYPGKTRRELIG